MADFAPLHWPDDCAQVLRLCEKARDYVQLETGADPDPAYVKETMTEAPESVPPDQVWVWGHKGPDGDLDGIVTCLKGYHDARDWYLGLLLLDPQARGAGLGARMAQHVMDQARADNAACLRVAILDTNSGARRFWQRLNFVHEFSTSAGDGQLRHIHRLHFKQEPLQ